jgi:hypothetical protein
VSSLGVLVLPWHPQILADQLTLSQLLRGTDYADLIITGTPGFSDLPTALRLTNQPKLGQAIPPENYAFFMQITRFVIELVSTVADLYFSTKSGNIIT